MDEIVKVLGGAPLAVSRSVEAILGGGIVIFPTDTTYAVGVNALDGDAVESVYALKNRSRRQALSVMLGSTAQIPTIASVDSRMTRMADELLPGKATLLLPNRRGGEIPAAPGAMVGVRVPSSRFCLALATSAGVPITATSANLAGHPDSYSLNAALDQLVRGGAPLIRVAVDGGRLEDEQPSTIIDLTGSRPSIVRPGAMPDSAVAAAASVAGYGYPN